MQPMDSDVEIAFEDHASAIPPASVTRWSLSNTLFSLEHWHWHLPNPHPGWTYQDGPRNTTYCAYKSNKATKYAVGAILFPLASQFLLMFMTKCGCFGRPQPELIELGPLCIWF